MPKVKPTVARTPEALAEALGLSAAAAKEWTIQWRAAERLKRIVRREKITPRGDWQRWAEDVAHKGDCNPEWQSRERIERSADSPPRFLGVPGQSIVVLC